MDISGDSTLWVVAIPSPDPWCSPQTEYQCGEPWSASLTTFLGGVSV